VGFALQLADVMNVFNRDYGADFQVKIGISSGVVMGGVIGKKRISFDLWGDTVNLASRIESVSKAGEISICEVTAGLILDRFELSKGRIVDLKGKGSTTVYSVLKSKQPSAHKMPKLTGNDLVRQSHGHKSKVA
jgi:class 3 adenylate cyclase